MLRGGAHNKRFDPIPHTLCANAGRSTPAAHLPSELSALQHHHKGLRAVNIRSVQCNTASRTCALLLLLLQVVHAEMVIWIAAVVLFTLTVNASLLGPLMTALGLNKTTPAQRHMHW